MTSSDWMTFMDVAANDDPLGLGQCVMTDKAAMILGAAGQDGAYLSRLLLRKGYRVVAVDRDATDNKLQALKRLNVLDDVEVTVGDVTDLASVKTLIGEYAPDEVYNLAAQSSVGLSYQKPFETFQSISTGTACVLEAMRTTDKPVRLMNANSSMIFADAPEPLSEDAPFCPSSPYAAARISSYWNVRCYREVYGLHACSAILFNHESPLRPDVFVTAKIVSAAVRIALGSNERLALGNLDVVRDWGWAEEYVDAMWRLLQQDQAEDCVVATGQGRKLSEFVARVFACLDLDWQDYVDINPTLLRTGEIMVNIGNPSKARSVLGWTAETGPDEVVEKLVAHELRRQEGMA